MTKLHKEQIKALDEMIDEFIKSGMSASEFMREHMFKEYSKTGDDKLKEVSIDYFMDKFK